MTRAASCSSNPAQFRLTHSKKTPTLFHTTCIQSGYYCLADAMADLKGFHVTRVDRSAADFVVTEPGEVFSPTCGVQAVADGRQPRLLRDISVLGVPAVKVLRRRA